MDSKILPAYVLLDYIWAVLKANTDMTEDDYDGLIPIVPLSEQPEIVEYDAPHIVYGFSESATPDLYAKQRGNMAFVVYSTNAREVSHITNIIAKTFNRADDAARDVNNFSSTIPAYVGLRFGYINTSYVEGGSPEESEGGRQSSAVNIHYEYYVDYDIDTSAGITS
jgi:hypothetical protein